MVRFRSWKDQYIFLRDYGNCTCLNCHYGGADHFDDSETHRDSEYALLFCRESISMVRFDMMVVCAKWRHKDTGKSIEEFSGDNMWNLTEDQLDLLDKDDKEWSIEEIRGLTDAEELD